ncbi:hypothetical protein MWG58_31690 [Streptomyces sp. WAC00276]|nr:insulinase family protein [Streptomyces sp. WAC00276]MCK2145388.1 hypothetical protein [Streptomyces sp. WAC00276]
MGQIVQPWFYNQLRTEEQLGYAVFAFPMSVGRQWGMGFLLQSNDKQPSFLWERYKAFFPTAEAPLRAMKPDRVCANPAGGNYLRMLQANPQTPRRRSIEVKQKMPIAATCASIRVIKSWPVIKPPTPQNLPISSIRRWLSSRKAWPFWSQISGSQNGKAEYVHS